MQPNTSSATFDHEAVVANLLQYAEGLASTIQAADYRDEEADSLAEDIHDLEANVQWAEEHRHLQQSRYLPGSDLTMIMSPDPFWRRWRLAFVSPEKVRLCVLYVAEDHTAAERMFEKLGVLDHKYTILMGTQVFRSAALLAWGDKELTEETLNGWLRSMDGRLAGSRVRGQDI